MINNAMSSGGSSMIRKITRGTSSANGDVTISCSITDTSKVIVLLNSDISVKSTSDPDGNISSASGGSVYLKSISSSNIVVCGHGVGTAGYRIGGSSTTYYKPDIGTITFSYQIIEFM